MPMAQNLRTFKALYVLFTSLCDLWREAVRKPLQVSNKQQATRTRTNKSKQQQATPSNNNSNNNNSNNNIIIIINNNNNRNGNRTNKLLPIPKVLGKPWPQKLYLVHHHRSVKHVEDVISFLEGGLRKPNKHIAITVRLDMLNMSFLRVEKVSPQIGNSEICSKTTSCWSITLEWIAPNRSLPLVKYPSFVLGCPRKLVNGL